MSDTTNSAGPPPEPALISAPTSVVRAVTRPSNGATMRLYFSSTRSAVEIGLRGFDQALLVRRESAARWSRSCFETAPEVDQRLAALQRLARKLGIGLRAGQVGLGLHDLLVEVGRLDLGEQLAGLHRRADVGLPFLQIAADARVELRLRIGLEPPRQVDRGAPAAVVRAGDRDGRHRLTRSVHSLSRASAMRRVVMPMPTTTAAISTSDERR